MNLIPPTRHPTWDPFLWIWLLALSVPILLGLHPWDSADTFMHLYRGRLIWQTGQLLPETGLITKHPDAVFYWMFQLGLYGLFKLGGYTLVTSAFTALWTVSWFLILRCSGLFRMRLLGVLWLIGAALVSSYRFTVRPETLSFLFFAIYLSLLKSWDWADRHPSQKQFLGRLAVCAGLQVLWAGCHGYFVFGPLLITVYFFSVILNGRNGTTAHFKTTLKQLLILIVITIGASGLSPFGLRTWSAAYNHAVLFRTLESKIYEFHSSFNGEYIAEIWLIKLFWILWGLTLLRLLWSVTRQRRFEFTDMCAAMGLYLSAASMRSLPFLPILSAGLWGRDLMILCHHRFFKKRVLWAGGLMATLALAVMIDILVVSGAFYRSIFSPRTFGFGLTATSFPVAISEFLRDKPLSGIVFNQPEDGGYLGFYHEGIRLYGDTQFTQAKEAIKYLEGFSPKGFEELDGSHHFKGALLSLNRSFDLIQYLVKTKNWSIATGDVSRVLLVPPGDASEIRGPREIPKFFAGQDLRFLPSSYALTQWSLLLAQKGDVELMRALLSQVDRSPVVPTPLLINATAFAANTGDREMLRQVIAMSQKAMSLTASEGSELVQLIRRANAILK